MRAEWTVRAGPAFQRGVPISIPHWRFQYKKTHASFWLACARKASNALGLLGGSGRTGRGGGGRRGGSRGRLLAGRDAAWLVQRRHDVVGEVNIITRIHQQRNAIEAHARLVENE